MKQRVLIAGGAGFGGTGLAKALKARGHEVDVLDFVAPLHTSVVDVADNYLWMALQDVTPEDVEDYDVVVNMAAQADVLEGMISPRWTFEQNVLGSVALLEALREAPPSLALLAGSGNEYGRPKYLPIDEEHPLVAHNPYAASKIAQESAYWAWHRAYNLPISVMSNGVVVGPEMRRQIFIYLWIRALLLGKPLILEGGFQTRDVTHCDDTIRAWVNVIEAPREKVIGEKFIVSYGEEHPLYEILAWCLEAFGGEIELEAFKQNIAQLLPSLEVGSIPSGYGVIRVPNIESEIRVTRYRPGEEGQRELFNTSKAERVLGYKGEVPPKEALSRTIAWVKTLYPSKITV